MRYILIILVFLSVGAKAQMVIKAHANYRPYAVAVAQNLLLDDYPNAAAAYSLRKLDKDYSGNAIRVRRSNDNAEQDIGFTSSGDLDTASLKTFVGAGNNGFVTVWYDQSGNARNATQTTAANQPILVNAGTIDRRSGDISLVYDGSNDFLVGQNTSGLNTFTTSYYAVSSRGITNDNLKTVMSTGILRTSTANGGYGFIYCNTTCGGLGSNVIHSQTYFPFAASSQGGFANTLNENSLTFSILTTTNTNIWVNSTNNASSTYTASNATVAHNLHIGARLDDANSPGLYLNGTTTEIVIWQSNQSSNRTGIENNINDYYNIYWNGDFAGLLDSFPSSAAAYSLRNLDKDYLGPLVRVRRSNDNAEQDIFGDYYGNLDTVGLKNFVGAGNNGFVTVWYDQSGNASNATQSTAANQPRIMNAGVIDRVNTKPAIFYDGTNDRFATNIQTMDLTSGDNISAFTTIRPTVVNVFNTIITKFNSTSGVNDSEDGWGFRISSGAKINAFFAKDVIYSQTTSTTNETANTQRLFSWFANGGSLTTNVNIFGNGTEFGYTKTGTTTTLDNTNYVIYIGALLYQTAFYDHWNGSMQEIILYNADKRTDRTGIEGNINTHYSIY